MIPGKQEKALTATQSLTLDVDVVQWETAK